MIYTPLPTSAPLPTIEASSVYPGYLAPVGAKYQYKPVGFIDTASWGTTGFILRGLAGWYIGKQISTEKRAPLVSAAATAFLGVLGPVVVAAFYGSSGAANRRRVRSAYSKARA